MFISTTRFSNKLSPNLICVSTQQMGHVLNIYVVSYQNTMHFDKKIYLGLACHVIRRPKMSAKDESPRGVTGEELITTAVKMFLLQTNKSLKVFSTDGHCKNEGNMFGCSFSNVNIEYYRFTSLAGHVAVWDFVGRGADNYCGQNLIATKQEPNVIFF